MVSFRKPTANTIPSICFPESDNPEQGHPPVSPQMCLMQLKYHNTKTGPVQQLFTLCISCFYQSHILILFNAAYINPTILFNAAPINTSISFFCYSNQTCNFILLNSAYPIPDTETCQFSSMFSLAHPHRVPEHVNLFPFLPLHIQHRALNLLICLLLWLYISTLGISTCQLISFFYHVATALWTLLS